MKRFAEIVAGGIKPTVSSVVRYSISDGKEEKAHPRANRPISPPFAGGVKIFLNPTEPILRPQRCRCCGCCTPSAGKYSISRRIIFFQPFKLTGNSSARCVNLFSLSLFLSVNIAYAWPIDYFRLRPKSKHFISTLFYFRFIIYKSFFCHDYFELSCQNRKNLVLAQILAKYVEMNNKRVQRHLQSHRANL